MGNNFYVANPHGARVGYRCGTVTLVKPVVRYAATLKPVKSNLVVRSSQDLKAARVPAYSYLIP